MVDLIRSHLELFRRMKASIGLDVMASLSTEERDEKLKEAMLVARELHPALISPEAEYKVLKRLMGAVVALVLRREDLRCRLLKSIARELLTCSVLLPALNFASPG
jgi:sorting nexin-13